MIRDDSSPPTLPALFAAQVHATPDAVAVIAGHDRVTFRQLAARAAHLARGLRALGAAPDLLVGIYLDRTLDMVAALLAVLESGAAYLPLDPAYPDKRLADMVADSGAPLVLAEPRLVRRLPQSPARVLTLDDVRAAADLQPPSGGPGAAPLAHHLAYVLYTSGSTGRPKGVAVEHRSVAAFLAWAGDAFGAEERRAVYAGTSLCFDISVTELFLPLCHGGAVVLGDTPLSLLDLPAAGEVTLFQAVPSAMVQLLRTGKLPDSVRTVILAGEPLRNQLAQEIYASSRVERIVNGYGPTEATVYTTTAEVPRGSTEEPPIGRAVAKVQLLVLDEALEPVPRGTAGELYLGGSALARGYLGRPDLTAERFLPRPGAGGPAAAPGDERIYKTGDLVRERPDGQLEFLGRADRQIKLNGFRIELEEVEIALSRIPGIRLAAAQVRDEPPAPGERREPRLVAYFTVDPERALPLPAWQLHRLPNGVPISTLNPAEADHLYDVIFQRRAYLRHGLRIDDGDVVLDVGGNIGLFSLFAELECDKPRVLAFEPVPRIAGVLRANIAVCGLGSKVLPFGLSDAPKTVEFTFYPRWSALSGAYGDRSEEERLSRAFLRNEEGLGEYANELVDGRFEGQLLSCEMRTVSQVMRDEGLDRVDLLKVNVEKSELDVLRGVEPESWPRIRQCVVEVHDAAYSGTPNAGATGRLEEVLALLRAHGFTVEADQDPIMRNTGLVMVYAWRAEDPRLARPVAPPRTPAERLPGLRRPALTIEGLRAELRSRLPDFMIPQVFVALDGMPSTPNGKVDRKALPPLTGIPLGYRAVTPYEAPEDPLEQAIAEVWQELLELPRVGARDNFFDIGGGSRLAAAAHRRIVEKTSRDFPITDLFRFPTARTLAGYLVSNEAGGSFSVDAGRSRGAARRAIRHRTGSSEG